MYNGGIAPLLPYLNQPKPSPQLQPLQQAILLSSFPIPAYLPMPTVASTIIRIAYILWLADIHYYVLPTTY